MKQNNRLISIFAVLSYILMVTVNILANMIPINGMTTGEISDLYPNLFAPIGFTFAIWGVIYLLLAFFLLYLLGVFKQGNHTISWEHLHQITLLFIINSVLNALWIFEWHYLSIFLSVILMIGILLTLIGIALIIAKSTLSQQEVYLVKLPFSVYFGWISVATIANITTLLVALQWNRFGLSEVTWTILILIVGVLITAVTTWKLRSVGYGITVLWAYLGILAKHISPAEFDFTYPSIIITVIILMLLLIATIVATLWKKNNKMKA